MNRRLITVLAAGLFATSAFAQVTVTEPWVRATVPAQKAAGAFLQIQSVQAAKLVAVSTPVAGRAELHEMAMADNTMRMRQVTAIDLPAGQPVALASGGYHIMFLELKRQLKEGETVPLILTVEESANKRSEIKVDAHVRALTYVAPKPAHAGMHGH